MRAAKAFQTLAYWCKAAAARIAVILATSLSVFLAISLWIGSFSVLAEQAKTEFQGAGFVGSERCVQCHAAEHADWNVSQHKAAMQEATEKTVLGNFDGATFTKNDIESTFFKKDDKFWVRTDGPDGKLADFEIRYTFGVAPLQQYLIELPGGRLQALGIAWDARPKEDGGRRWYHLYPDRKLHGGDPLHWTGIDQNWNYQCAYCHSTNLQKNYNSATGEFKTTKSEISVGCEACHGPASNHMTWATKSKGWDQYDEKTKGFALSLDERKGVTWPMDEGGQAARSIQRTTEKEVQVCAACHARRQQFSDKPQDISRFFDAFRPSLLEAGLYHTDGQQRDEVYNYGSFLQSRMHAAGVTCSDCHNPHSGKLRQTGNAVCAGCHAPERFDAPSHHHHDAGSTGALCISCHMPTTTYMGVDARHDHSIRIPRPDRTVILATPNACNRCHSDKTAAWAKDAIKSWYPTPKQGAQDFAEAFDRGDLGAPGAQVSLQSIAEASTASAISRASAITRLRRYPSPKVLEIAARSLKIDDPPIRCAAISVIADADPATRKTLLVPLLRDETRLVRMDAARALAGEAERELSPDDAKALQQALTEYVEAQLFNAERPESSANLGALYRDQGKMTAARAAFEKAIKLDSKFFAAAISLADLMRSEGNESEAEAILQQALIANPDSGPVEHAIGLSLIRQKRTAEAIASLAKAAVSSPDDSRFSYVLAIAHHDTGNLTEAIATLKSALVRHPYDRDTLWALASYEIETKDYSTARQRAELLNELEPGRADVVQLLASFKRLTR